MLELSGVSRVVDGEQWLTDVDLSVGPGLHVLTGQSLAGKTTLLRIIAGLDRPDTGSLVLDGDDITGMPVRRRDVAFVYQDFINYPAMTARENIAAPLRRARDRSEEEIAERVAELAGLLSLERYLDRRPAELSGGQQQRVAIARALAKRSGMLLLDEPLANLDYKLREELRDELAAIFEGDDRIVIYSTSEPAEALHFGADTIVVHEGRILQTGPAVSVYRGPGTSTVARVFSDPPMNLVPARFSGGVLQLGDAQQFTAPQPSHFAGIDVERLTVGVRPHQVALTATGDGGDVAVDGIVTLTELTGSDTFIHLDVDGVTLVAEVPGVHSHPLGEVLTVHLAPGGLYAFDADDGHLLAAPAIREVLIGG